MATTLQTEFRLTYDGPALASGRMAVRDLAPALLAIGDLFQESNTVTWPGAPPVGLEIRAFEPGSFEVLLNVTADGGVVVQQAIGLLNTPASIAGATLITYVTAFLILAKKLRGRKVVARELPEPGKTTLILDNHTSITIQTEVLNLYQTDTVRQHARQAISPLRTPGVREMRIEAPNIPGG